MTEPMKALVGAIQKFSTEDGPGIRTTVFLKGCPLNCAWCHNPELIDFDQEVIRMANSCIKCGYCLEHCPKNAIFVNPQGVIDIDREKCDKCLKCTEFCFAKALQSVAVPMTVTQVMDRVAEDIDFYNNTGGGMTISGGEILSQAAFAEALIQAAAEKGINVCIDTSGFGDRDTLMRLAAYDNVQYVLYDMKSIDEDVHKKYTGVSNKVILGNLKALAENPATACKIKMRMPIITGVNDSEEIISATIDFYKAQGIKALTLLPYHALGQSKKRNIGGVQEDFQTPSDEFMDVLKERFAAEAGMDVEILGRL